MGEADERAATADALMRHIRACNNAVLPGRRLPFCLGTARVGWVEPELAAFLLEQPEVTRVKAAVVLRSPVALDTLAARAARYGFGRRRGELFDVFADAPSEEAALAQVDRGALPAFGIAATGVHVNGLVRGPDGVRMWIARRSAQKSLDPGKLDHLVAGGVSAGMTALETLEKEGEEEAALPAELAAAAEEVGRMAYSMERFEGLRRDRLICYDLWLPEEFVPRPADGEVDVFELWQLERVLTAVRDTDDFKFNVNLVLIDLFIRFGLVAGAEAARLRAALDAGRALFAGPALPAP